jgi:large subunit ribosomal protein L25
MEKLRLDVEKRQGTGKSATRKIRAQGAVPAVLYGAGTPSLTITVKAREAERVLASGANRLIDLGGIPEVKGKLALIKEFTREPVSRQLLHFDFYAVDTSKAVEVSIPVHMTGKPKGVEQGGVLEQLLRDVAVSCLPLAIPDSVSIDVSELEIGDTRYARELVLPEGVALLTDEDAAVVHVLAPRVEAEPTPAAETSAEGAEGAAAADAKAE